MTEKNISSLQELLDRLEGESNRRVSIPSNIFTAIARKLAAPDFLLQDQAAWNSARSTLEIFAAGKNYQLGKGALEILAAVACRKTPLLATDKSSFTPQLQAVSALSVAFKSSHQNIQSTAAEMLGKYGSSGQPFSAMLAVDALRKGFGAEDHFVVESVLTSFARAATSLEELQDVKNQIAGLEAGLQNPRTAHDVGTFLLKLARRGPQEAAFVINLIDWAFLTPKLDSEVYDEGVEMLAKIGPRDKASARRAVTALEDLNPAWQAGRNGRAGAVSALPKIALSQPSVAAQAIDVLFGSLKSNFEDNDAWIQIEAVDAVIKMAVSFPEHADDIGRRLKNMAVGAYGDIAEMTGRALNGIEPALRIAQEHRALTRMVRNFDKPSQRAPS